MATSGGAANSRLCVDDWVQEGFRVLAEDGVKALTLGRLCSRLGVTKGSFYWHFSDMKAYREALIDTWAAVRDEDRRSFDDLASEPPRQRLSRMMTALVGPRHWVLERAMREWARSESAEQEGKSRASEGNSDKSPWRTSGSESVAVGGVSGFKL